MPPFFNSMHLIILNWKYYQQAKNINVDINSRWVSHNCYYAAWQDLGKFYLRTNFKIYMNFLSAMGNTYVNNTVRNKCLETI